MSSVTFSTTIEVIEFAPPNAGHNSDEVDPRSHLRSSARYHLKIDEFGKHGDRQLQQQQQQKQQRKYVIITSEGTIRDDEASPKPHSEPFKKFMAEHNVNGNQSAMFEDLPRNLEPAKVHGMTTAFVDGWFGINIYSRKGNCVNILYSPTIHTVLYTSIRMEMMQGVFVARRKVIQ